MSHIRSTAYLFFSSGLRIPNQVCKSQVFPHEVFQEREGEVQSPVAEHRHRAWGRVCVCVSVSVFVCVCVCVCACVPEHRQSVGAYTWRQHRSRPKSFPEAAIPNVDCALMRSVNFCHRFEYEVLPRPNEKIPEHYLGHPTGLAGRLR